MIDVAAAGTRLRQAHALRIERRGVPLRDLTPPFGPRLEVAQLHAQDRALDAVHPVIESLQAMLVSLLLAPVAQRPARRRDVRSRRRDGAALAVGA